MLRYRGEGFHFEGILRQVNKQTTITTERLILRPFTLADAADVQRLAGGRAVADRTQATPHPYEDGMAENWIAAHEQQFQQGIGCIFAIVRKADGVLVASVSFISIEPKCSRAELGYWLGKPYWNQGYATEAAGALIKFGFEVLNLNRIFGEHLSRNPASGRVMAKIGMQHEGTLCKHATKWGVFEDVEVWGLLATDPR